MNSQLFTLKKVFLKNAWLSDNSANQLHSLIILRVKLYFYTIDLQLSFQLFEL